jgi:glucosamine-phosphate N-acetyltransferase
MFGVFFIEPEKHKITLVGTASLYLQHRYYRNAGISGAVEDFVIDKDHQTKGLGSALLLKIIEYSKNCGVYKLALNCDTNVIPFYQKKGFESKKISLELYFSN